MARVLSACAWVISVRQWAVLPASVDATLEGQSRELLDVATPATPALPPPDLNLKVSRNEVLVQLRLAF